MTFFCHVCEGVYVRDTRFFSGPLTFTTMLDGFATNLPVAACDSCGEYRKDEIRPAYGRWCAGYRPMIAKATEVQS